MDNSKIQLNDVWLMEVGQWAKSHKCDKWWTQACGTIWGSWKMVELR